MGVILATLVLTITSCGDNSKSVSTDNADKFEHLAITKLDFYHRSLAENIA